MCNVNSVYVDNNHYSLIKFLSFMQMGSQFVTQVFQVKKKKKINPIISVYCKNDK